MSDPRHYCLQSARLTRIEGELAQNEARRREDQTKTVKMLGDLASQFDDAVDRMREAGDTLGAASAQIRKLFARVDALAARLEPGDK